MNDDRIDSGHWSHGKVWGTIALVFVVQVALIFGLSNRSAATPRAVPATPRVRLDEGSGEMLALLDPTLFALPHPRPFSGDAWAGVREFQPADWSEEPLWLDL